MQVPCDDYMPALKPIESEAVTANGKFQDLFERILEAQQRMIEAGQKPNEIIINGRKYGKLVGNMYNPHLFGMAVKTEINLPDDYDFVIQKVIRPSMTNSDRIRGMSDEELALWKKQECPDNPRPCLKVHYRVDCTSCWLAWLKKEVDE